MSFSSDQIIPLILGQIQVELSGKIFYAFCNIVIDLMIKCISSSKRSVFKMDLLQKILTSLQSHYVSMAQMSPVPRNASHGILEIGIPHDLRYQITLSL